MDYEREASRFQLIKRFIEGQIEFIIDGKIPSSVFANDNFKNKFDSMMSQYPVRGNFTAVENGKLVAWCRPNDSHLAFHICFDKSLIDHRNFDWVSE